MAIEPFYRLVDKEILQGDIFEEVPQLFLRPPLLALRRVTLAGGREAFGFYPFPPPADDAPGGPSGRVPPGGPFHFGTGEQTSAFCQVTRAIILNHDCDIENEPDHRLVALVRPLSPVPAEHQEIIRHNQNFNYFYLPAEDGLPEAYVDFRRLTSLSPDFLPVEKRIAALAVESVKALQAQFFRFLTRRDLIG
jgi:hypothetical protein